MKTAGPVALLGGHEHRQGNEAIEHTLLDQAGVAAPRVAVLPVASARRQAGMVAALARNYWTNLGASVRIAMPDRGGSRQALQAVADADVIVLTGGVPNRLVAALGASPVWDLILQRWRDGAAISGSSAAAMSLFTWRLRLYPPNMLDLIPGLGPLRGWIAAPHFNRFRAHRWAEWLSHRFGDLGLLGLDEGTAIIGRQGRFTVAGKGAVTLIRDGHTGVHRAGARLRLHTENHPQTRHAPAGPGRVDGSPGRPRRDHAKPRADGRRPLAGTLAGFSGHAGGGWLTG